MNKGIMIAAGVIIVLVLGGTGFLISRRSTQAPAATTGESQSESAVQPQSQKKTLKEIMGLAGDQKCEFADTETGSTGSIYVSGGKFRGDFTMQSEGTSTRSHMISDTENAYMWMDGQNQGFKFSVAALTAGDDAAQQQAVDVNKEVDIDCSGWSGGEASFEVPANVTFSDFGGLIPTGGITGSAGEGNAVACAACDQVPAEARAQCRASLNCE